MEKNRFSESEKLKKEVRKDISSAFEAFMQFIEANNQSAEIKTQGLLLGSKLFDFIEENESIKLPEEKKQILTEEAVSIIDSINNAPPAQPEDDSILKLRHHFLSLKSDDIVFSGVKLCKKYNSFELKAISVALRLGEITSVVGENGNGKSTLLKIIAGEISNSTGYLNYPLFGTDLHWSDIKKNIAYVPQELPVWRNVLSVKQQLHYTASVKGIRGQANDDAVQHIIMRLGLKKYEDFSWSDLSGGYKLRFELARQLVWNPKLLILDEPLAHLDVKAQNLLLNDLRSLTDRLNTPMSVLISSQNLYDVENIADNVIFISGGEARYNGPVQNISDKTGFGCFILNAESTLLELQNSFADFSDEIFDIRDEYQYKLVFTSSGIHAGHLLNALINSGIKINHFRDISNSTRVFFENTQFGRNETV